MEHKGILLGILGVVWVGAVYIGYGLYSIARRFLRDPDIEKLLDGVES